MTNYFDKQEAKAAFLAMARSKPALQGIADGQLMDMLGTHLGLVAEAALYNADRNLQESYLATAINRTSVLAAAYDRNYIPRKPKPSGGSVRVVNESSSGKSVPVGTVLISDDLVHYEVETPVVVDAGQNALVTVSQIFRESLEFTLSNPSPYYEILLEPEKSRQVHDIKVFVNGVEWDKTRLFRNTNSESTVWAEIYTPLDQLGVRFGNGIFGKIPDTDSTVTLELILTSGDVVLLNEQSLTPVDPSGAFIGVEFISGTPLSGGENIEGTEETRRNALYYFQYDEKHEWDDDYAFMLRQKFPDLLFCKVWGEEKQENMVGYRAIEHINHIFFSVYATGKPLIHVDVLAELQTMPEYNRFFTHTPVAHQKFTFSIEGSIKRSLVMHEIEAAIRTLIDRHYGQDSKDRRERALVRDFYKLMNGLTHNGMAVFESQDDVFITLSGVKEPIKLYDMVSVNMADSVLELSYA